MCLTIHILSYYRDDPSWVRRALADGSALMEFEYQLQPLHHTTIKKSNRSNQICVYNADDAHTRDRRVKWSRDSSALGYPECSCGSVHSHLWSTAQTVGLCSLPPTSSWKQTDTALNQPHQTSEEHTCVIFHYKIKRMKFCIKKIKLAFFSFWLIIFTTWLVNEIFCQHQSIYISW